MLKIVLYSLVKNGNSISHELLNHESSRETFVGFTVLLLLCVFMCFQNDFGSDFASMFNRLPSSDMYFLLFLRLTCMYKVLLCKNSCLFSTVLLRKYLFRAELNSFRES